MTIKIMNIGIQQEKTGKTKRIENKLVKTTFWSFRSLKNYSPSNIFLLTPFNPKNTKKVVVIFLFDQNSLPAKLPARLLLSKSTALKMHWDPSSHYE